LSFVPTPFTAVMMASAMPAAIRAYSMAVAPDSSFRKALKTSWPPQAAAPRQLVGQPGFSETLYESRSISREDRIVRGHLPLVRTENHILQYW
jgi:hypothetical protein